MHENLQRQHPYRTASPRAFGLLLTVVLGIVAFYPLLDRGAPRWWISGIAFLTLAAALFAPSVYALPNRAWTRLGTLLARVVSPIALVVIFYGVFVPMAWCMRLFGRKPLELSYDSDADSYWIERKPPGPDSASLRNPF